MSLTTVQLLDQVLQLPPDQREAFVDEVLRSLESDEAESPFDPAYDRELEERIRSVERGEAETLDWAESLAEIRRELAEGKLS